MNLDLSLIGLGWTGVFFKGFQLMLPGFLLSSYVGFESSNAKSKNFSVMTTLIEFGMVWI